MDNIKVVGTYCICNCGGYEVGEDCSENLFFRDISGDVPTPWEPLEVMGNPDDECFDWAYNPDIQAFLFPMYEVMRVA